MCFRCKFGKYVFFTRFERCMCKGRECQNEFYFDIHEAPSIGQQKVLLDLLSGILRSTLSLSFEPLYRTHLLLLDPSAPRGKVIEWQIHI